MEIANDPSHRIRLEERKTRRRQLLNMFFKYINQDVTIMTTPEYDRLIKENKTLIAQVKLLNEMRQADLDRRDIHRPVKI